MEETATPPSLAKQIFYYPITRILIGLVVIIGTMVLFQFSTSWLLKLMHVADDARKTILSIEAPIIVLLAYSLLYKYYEKRSIDELKASALPGWLLAGAIIGIGLQSLVILVMYLMGGYSIVSINPVSFILPGLLIAFTSGIIEEVLLRGVVFRIINEKWGSIIALAVSALLFGLLHLMNKNSSLYSAIAIAIEAGILLGACYIYSGNLWLPIGVHFGWNFAEADLFGGVLSGNVIDKTLITAKFTGSEYLTGGAFGPENSLPSILICTAAGVLLLWLAYKKKRLPDLQATSS
jgi:membrane protease YdiL (CAAX protease family)